MAEEHLWRVPLGCGYRDQFANDPGCSSLGRTARAAAGSCSVCTGTVRRSGPRGKPHVLRGRTGHTSRSCRFPFRDCIMAAGHAALGLGGHLTGPLRLAESGGQCPSEYDRNPIPSRYGSCRRGRTIGSWHRAACAPCASRAPVPRRRSQSSPVPAGGGTLDHPRDRPPEERPLRPGTSSISLGPKRSLVPAARLDELLGGAATIGVSVGHRAPQLLDK